MSDVTQLLNAIDAGEPKAADQLLPLVYEAHDSRFAVQWRRAALKVDVSWREEFPTFMA